MTTNEARARNLARGTEVRQARARLKRALAAGEITPRELITGIYATLPGAANRNQQHIATADRMPLEALLKACGADPIDVLMRADALDLRGYRTNALTAERRREIADAFADTPED
jgi:hypothetical protein